MIAPSGFDGAPLDGAAGGGSHGSGGGGGCAREVRSGRRGPCASARARTSSPRLGAAARPGDRRRRPPACTRRPRRGPRFGRVGNFMAEVQRGDLERDAGAPRRWRTRKSELVLTKMMCRPQRGRRRCRPAPAIARRSGRRSTSGWPTQARRKRRTGHLGVGHVASPLLHGGMLVRARTWDGFFPSGQRRPDRRLGHKQGDEYGKDVRERQGLQPPARLGHEQGDDDARHVLERRCLQLGARLGHEQGDDDVHVRAAPKPSTRPSPGRWQG